MSAATLEQYLRERLAVVFPDTDLTPGSPIDTRLIQPILRRVGTDPFSTDLGTFIQDRIAQQFPDMATKEGDALTDLLVKPLLVLWDPIVREIERVNRSKSLRDPETLTVDEAEALGANLFASRHTGDRALGVARIYFAAPQNVAVSPANYLSSKGNLRFFPTEAQSIRMNEMLYNKEGALYYFDVNVVAGAPGDQYNIGPGELITIANITSATKVTNKSRFRFGQPDESVVEYVGRMEQELTERSLVTLPGITAQLPKAFPEISHIGVVGFNDPEMQRDVLTGGGLGPILAAGFSAQPVVDGENRLRTRRLRITTALPEGFFSLVGPAGAVPKGFVVTLFDAFGPGALPRVRDLAVRAVVDDVTLDLEEQVLYPQTSPCVWTLRANSLTLSDIPGGILFPDTPQGTVTIPNGQVHIGGATDIHVRGTGFDTTSLLLDSVVDDRPILQGTKLQVVDGDHVRLADLVLGTDYAVGDDTYLQIQRALAEGLTLQVLETPIAAAYRVLSVTQVPGQSPVFQVTPSLPTPLAGGFRWRLLDELDIDLNEPKETRIAGTDLYSVQGVDYFDTTGGIDFDEYGVAPGDILRVFTGSVAGDYTVVQVLTPLYRRVKVDRPVPSTASGLKYAIFRPNAGGGLALPLVRISSIDILDTSGQPVGSTLPYAAPVDVRSRSFANVAQGVKAEMDDAILGIVTNPLPAGAVVGGRSLVFSLTTPYGPLTFSVVFTGGGALSPATISAQIDAQVSAASAGLYPTASVVFDTNRVGVLPLAPDLRIAGGSAVAPLFGTSEQQSVGDIRSATVRAAGGWAALSPALDAVFDVAQVVGGANAGFFADLVFSRIPVPGSTDALVARSAFSPSVQQRVLVGARSLGSARVYFLEPTSFEVRPDTVFRYTRPDGGVLRFLPDPTNTHQRIPSLPSGVKPKDGATSESSPGVVDLFESATIDFITKGIQKGDLLTLDYAPLQGSIPLADPVVGLHTQVLTLSIDDGSDKRVVFIHDDNSISSTAVTRAGVVAQINRAVGLTICALNGDRLEFNPDALVRVRGGGTANALLGFSTVAGTDNTNASVNSGTYTVLEAAPAGNPNRLRVTPSFSVPDVGRQQFKVARAGVQRISSTEMAKQVAEAGLYYFDVQLISEGTGDVYNLVDGGELTVEGYRSDGYYLITEDPNLSFSQGERVRLRISRSILEVGVTDDPENATPIPGQNLQINFDRSTLVGNVQTFVSSELERVVTESPLARHLTPYFVRFALSYTGGSKESEVLPDVLKYILTRRPDESVLVSQLQKIVQTKGATEVVNPIDLVAVVHPPNRRTYLERSQDRLNTGRLAGFFPDVVTLTRLT